VAGPAPAPLPAPLNGAPRPGGVRAVPPTGPTCGVIYVCPRCGAEYAVDPRQGSRPFHPCPKALNKETPLVPKAPTANP